MRAKSLFKLLIKLLKCCKVRHNLALDEFLFLSGRLGEGAAANAKVEAALINKFLFSLHYTPVARIVMIREIAFNLSQCRLSYKEKFRNLLP